MTINLSIKEIDEICKATPHYAVSRVNKFVMFLGHAHSGHSIIGSILDSHHDAGIVNELNLPKLLLDKNLDRETINI